MWNLTHSVNISGRNLKEKYYLEPGKVEDYVLLRIVQGEPSRGFLVRAFPRSLTEVFLLFCDIQTLSQGRWFTDVLFQPALYHQIFCKPEPKDV